MGELSGRGHHEAAFAGEDDREHAIDRMRRTLPAIRGALVSANPDLAPRMENYPGDVESS